MLALALALLCLLFARLGFGRRRRLRYRRTRLRAAPAPRPPTGFPTRKPEWVRPTVLKLGERTGYSHRKLADTFNRLYFARTGVSVGRTWVREQLMEQAYRALHAQRRFKHRVPPTIRRDNHPVHDARRFKTVMPWLGIRLRFSQPASPWQNGRIERFFGTLKGQLQGLCFLDHDDVLRGLMEFRHDYNHVRRHQHLGGRTPAVAWRDIDPYRRSARRWLWYQGWGGRLRGWQLQH